MLHIRLETGEEVHLQLVQRPAIYSYIKMALIQVYTEMSQSKSIPISNLSQNMKCDIYKCSLFSLEPFLQQRMGNEYTEVHGCDVK